MMSNIGSEYILDVVGDDFKYEEMYKWVMGGLWKYFCFEFLNRVDEIILFYILRKGELC